MQRLRAYTALDELWSLAGDIFSGRHVKKLLLYIFFTTNCRLVAEMSLLKRSSCNILTHTFIHKSQYTSTKTIVFSLSLHCSWRLLYAYTEFYHEFNNEANYRNGRNVAKITYANWERYMLLNQTEKFVYVIN